MVEMLSLDNSYPSLNASLSKVDPFQDLLSYCPLTATHKLFTACNNLMQVFIYVFLGHILEYKLHKGKHPLGQFCSPVCSGDSLSGFKHSRLLVSWVDSSNSNELRN